MFAATVLGSFVLYLVIGAVMGRKVKDKSDFYVAGRSAPTLLVAGTLVASFLSTVSFMGELGFSYDGFPIAMLILVALNISGYVLGVLGFGRYLRRSEALTVPEFFGRRFDSRNVQIVAGLMVVVGIGLYLVAVTQGLGLVIAQLIGWPDWTAIIVVWLAYTVFTLMSGAKGILVNDTIMFIVFMIAGVLGMSWVIGEAGGPGAAFDKMTALPDKPDGLSWHGVTGSGAYMGSPGEVLLWSLTLGIVWMTVVAISPWQSSRYLMAKNEHVCLRSGFIAMGSVGALYIFLTFGAFAINIFKSDISPSEIAFIWAAQNIMPAALGVIAVTGIVAAGLSSAAAFLALIGFSAAHDVLRHLPRFQSEGSEKAALRTSQRIMLVVGVVVLAITLWSPPAVLTIGYLAATLFAAAWGPTAIWSIRGKKISARGAISGMTAGFLGVGILSSGVEFGWFTLPVWADPVLIGFALSIAAILIGNIGQQPSAESVRFRDSILRTPEQDRDPARLRITWWTAAATTGIFLVVLAAMIWFYAIPSATQV